jgi:ribosome-associated toxin RatA of RatAB toxin-antitoxin module
MSQASKTIEVDTDCESFFDIVVDFESYPEFLESVGMVKATVDSVDGNEMVATQYVKKMGKTVSYTLKFVLDRPRKVSWTLIKGQMMSVNEGSWEIEDIGDGRCKATYSAEVRFGMLVPKSLIKLLVSHEMPSMLEAFQKRALELKAK